MTSFSFTTGNPNNLVANQNASMADIQGPLTDLRAFINGGTMDETNVPNLAAAFTYWKTIGWGGATFLTGAVAGTYVIPWGAGGTAVVVGGTGTGLQTFVLDPVDYAANARTTKYRIRWEVITNAVAPAVTLTPGLYPVATFGGAAGNSPTVATVGTVVAGSTATFTAPAASTNNAVLSSEFNAPGSGNFVLGAVNSALFAANSSLHLLAQLQMRQV